MSKFFKIALALVSSFFVTTSLYAQATIEEVIVTAQRTEQSLQDVPIAVSAFTDEVLAERQIEYASDIQLQVPGVNFTATQFGAGGFSIRGITNLATAASADAGVEIHLNGMPLGLTSVSEIQYLDMERLEVLRGPQGTLFGRNATGGVINLITAKPDLDEFYGSADIKYGSDAEKMLTMMLNIPITDQFGFRFAYTNLQKDGVHENIYSRAGDDFDNRDGHQWRASFRYEFDDDLTIDLIHNAYHEESARNQVSGVFCETGGSLAQGCVVGGQQVFQQISPMSNGSTLPSLLGGNLAFYFPGGLGCTFDTDGTTPVANDGTCYNPLAALAALDATVPAQQAGALAYAGLVDVPNIPNEFFQANLWRSPIHQAQESTSQLLLEKDFDEGSLTASVNVKKRVFYRDTSSLSKEASSIRWAAGLQHNNALYLTDGGTLGGVTGDANSAMPMVGVPLGYSNSYISPSCDLDQGRTGVFGGADCIRGFHELPVSGDASFSDSTSTTYEIKYASDLGGDFDFLVGAINISNSVDSFYDVYASGITMNGLQLPGTISSSYRDGFYQAVGCGMLLGTTIVNENCADPDPTTAANEAHVNGSLVIAGIGQIAGTLNAANAALCAATDAATNGCDAALLATQMLASANAALDKISRIDGVYTEHFHNETKPFKLDASAIFTEFYFDVADNHKLTLGLRYTEDQKEVNSRATFYDTPLVTAWDESDADYNGTGGTAKALCEGAGAASFEVDGGADGIIGGANAADDFLTGNVNAASDACIAIGATVGQAIGSAPVVGLVQADGTANPLASANASQYLLLGIDAFNADYTSNGVTPFMEFSNTTGRFVWDWQIDDDTLMYVSYAKGFKGGGFNPPFDADQFPDTPFAFESTQVDSIELGIKATVPEIGLVANASFYYNDFENFHLGSIRNETAINYGIPLESYGAELELLLNPPSVPGLSFNMQLSLYDSEIGDVTIVNPHDLGGHYNGLADSANWHVMKSATANSFLVNKQRMGYIYGSILQTTNAAIAGAASDAALIGEFVKLAETNEFAAGALAAGTAAAGQVAAGGGDAAAQAAAQAGGITATLAAGGLIIAPEMNAAATAYGNKSTVCHNLQLPTNGGADGIVGGANAADDIDTHINTCYPAATAALLGMVGTNLAAGHVPADSLVYSPVALTTAGADGDYATAGDNVLLAGPTGTLLPSIGILGSGDTIQTTGLCTLWGVFNTDYTAGAAGAAMTANGVTHVSALVDDAGTTGTTGIQTNAAEACVGTATLNPGFISQGNEQSISGNKMPFSDVTLSLGLAYTFQTNNLEVTPRLDYYYRSDSNQSVFNIEQNKVPAWDEVNFRLNIVPTNGDWRVIFYGQNLTDERNITATAITNSSTSHTNSTFVREPRSFGLQFGIDF